LEVWDARQAAIDSGELPWDLPDPGPSVVCPDVQPASSISVDSRPTIRPDPAKSQTKSKPTAPPKVRKPAPAKPVEQPRLTQAPLLLVQLPDLSNASEGTFSQRLKRVQMLSKKPTSADIAELTVYLAAPEGSLCWLAGSTLSKIGGPQIESALKSLLELEIANDAREEAAKILSIIS
jgi:hypothetical protein